MANPSSIELAILSGSTGGRGIKMASTSSSPTTIHATQASATVQDKIRLYAVNNDAVYDGYLTIEFGGQTAPDDQITTLIPSRQGLLPICDIPLMGTSSSASRTVDGWASSSVGSIVVFGEVRRITP